MSLDDSDSSEGESVDEIEEGGLSVTCLFCERIDDGIPDSMAHAKSDHNVDLEVFLSENVRTTYDLVRVVTYLRSHGVRPEELATCGATRPWRDDRYLKPVDPGDPWLWTDFAFVNDGEDYVDEDDEPKYVNSENGVVTLSKEHFDQLQKRNLELEKIIADKNDQLERLRNLLNEPERPKDATKRPGDDSYFSSYASHDIHHQMLSDAPRMEAFKALFDATHLFQGKSVLDVGCGTGILSMMASAAGASSVLGVDNSDILYTALEIVAENGLSDRVRLLKCRVEDLDCEEKFDVIVSEWMGYLLLFEGMLTSVIDARDRFLKPDGLVFPRSFTIKLAGVSDKETRDLRTKSEYYGYKMSALRASGLADASVEDVRGDCLITEIAEVYTLDALVAKKEQCFFESSFTLVASRAGELTAVCGWFDAGFEPSGATLTTSPRAPATHWKQTVFYLERTLALRDGDRVACRISVEPGRAPDSRDIEVTLTVNGNVQTFFMA